MTYAAIALATVLSALSLLHVFWGLGGVWPGTDQASCARATTGFRGIDRMPPPPAAFAVAAALAGAALLALALGGATTWPTPGWPLTLAASGAAAVFAGRGIAGFTPVWRRLTPEQPFATLDVRLYSPLCLLIGIGFVALLIRGNPS